MCAALQMAEQCEVQRTLLKHLLDRIEEKERYLQAANKEPDQRRQQCRKALRRQQWAEETLEDTTKQLTDAVSRLHHLIIQTDALNFRTSKSFFQELVLVDTMLFYAC